MSSRETETLDLRHVGEVAAVIAKNSETVLRSVHCLASPSLQVFWEASRKRADLWQYALDDALEASRRDQPLGKHAVRSSSTVIGEVLATELVTRLWTAVIVGHEKRHQRQHEALARRVFSDHLTARRSSLRLLTHPIALPSSQIVTLDRIRQRAERWTDCLLATLPSDCGAAEFAFDRDRFDEFSEDTDVIARLSTRFSGWHLLSLSLRVASAEGPAADRTRNALHRAILDSIGAVIDAAETNWEPEAFGDDSSLRTTPLKPISVDTQSSQGFDQGGVADSDFPTGDFPTDDEASNTAGQDDSSLPSDVMEDLPTETLTADDVSFNDVSFDDDAVDDDAVDDDAVDDDAVDVGQPPRSLMDGATLSSNLIDRTDLVGVDVADLVSEDARSEDASSTDAGSADVGSADASSTENKAFDIAETVLAKTFASETDDARKVDRAVEGDDVSDRPTHDDVDRPEAAGFRPPSESVSQGLAEESSAAERLAGFGERDDLQSSRGSKPPKRRTIAVTSSGLQFRPLYESRR